MKNITTNVSTFFTTFIIIVSTFVVAAGSIDPNSGASIESGSQDERIILLDTEALGDGGASNKNELDFTVLHDYGDLALVEMNEKFVEKLKGRRGYVNTLPSRTDISVKGHTFDFTEEKPEVTLDGYEPGTEGLYIVHMLGPVSPEWRVRLEDEGADLINYIPNYAYEVSMTPETADDVKELPFVDWVGVYQPDHKFDPQLEPDKVNVRLNPVLEPDDVISLASESPLSGHREIDVSERRLTINITSRSELRELAKMNEVYRISEYHEPELHSEIESQIIGGGFWFTNDEKGDPTSPYRKHGDYGAYINQLGYTGDSVTIAVGDTGIGDGTIGDAGHPDLTGRVVGGHGFEHLDDWGDNHGHGTHVTGSAAGDTYEGSGNKGKYPGFGPYYMGQGLAYDSELYSARIFDPGWVGPDYYDIIELPKQEVDAYVHTNSWGSSTDGEYIESDEIFDKAVRDADRNTTGNQPMVITMSAGNQGLQEQTTSSPGNAKNVITVGATRSFVPDGGDYGGMDTDEPTRIARFSSRGWTKDNRVKPDVMAPGLNVLSLDNPNFSEGSTYEWMSGTSMSNPAVAGAASVVVEWYEENFGERPSPAMVRSLLINTADDIRSERCETEPIPNKDEGWGMVNISKLEYPKEDPIEFILEDQEKLLETGDVEEYEVQHEREDEPLKISLAWTDKNAVDGDNRTLKNDLNLEVEAPDGSVYRGNAFREGWTRPGMDTMEDFDHTGDGWDDANNVQNVYIRPEEVEDGTYTVRVIGHNVPADANNDGSANQDYALTVYNAAVPRTEIISPEECEVVRRSDVTLEWTSRRSRYHEVRLNQEDWIDVGGSESYTFEDLEDGNYTAEIRSVADKESVKNSVAFTVDTDPYIEIDSPEKEEVIRENDVEASWASYHAEGHEIRLNDKDWIDVGQNTRYMFEGLSDEEHTIHVRSSSDDENAFDSVNFSVDTDPYLKITSPEEKDMTGHGELEIRWISHNVGEHEIRLNDRGWVHVGNKTHHVFEEMNGGTYTVEVRAVDHDLIESIDLTFYLKKDPLHITGNDGLEKMAEMEGWPGTGVEDDPYVIEWYDIHGNEKSTPLKIEDVSEHFLVRNNRLHDANRSRDARTGKSGLLLQGTQNGRIENNNITLNTYGIQLEDSTGNVITNNTAVNNHVGIYVSSSDSNTLEGNHVQKSYHPVYDQGILLEESDGNEVFRNSIINNDQGLSVISSHENLLLENNASYNSQGIDLRKSEGNTVERTSLFTNTVGVYHHDSRETTINGTRSFDDNYGIYLTNSEDNLLYDNEIRHSRSYGILVLRSKNNRLEGNLLDSSNWYGIYLASSENTHIQENELIDDSLHLQGSSVEYWNTHTITEDNTVNGRPIIYRKDESDEVISGEKNASQIILANSENMVVRDQKIDVGDIGILMGFSDNNRIIKNNISHQTQSITIRHSEENVLRNNSLFNNTQGYYLISSDKNVISESRMYDNSWPGVYLAFSDHNLIFGNNFSKNDEFYGLGIYSIRSEHNHIYHNEFHHEKLGRGEEIGMEGQAYDDRENRWDDGVEGNYWSDYEERYPEASAEAGIWNESYEISGNQSEDRYPLVERDPIDEFSTYIFNPTDGETVYTSDVTVMWASKRAEGDINYEIRLNQEGWIDVDDERSHHFEDLPQGEHSVEVRGRDEEGRESNHSIDFSVELDVHVEITSPDNESIERRSSVKVEWWMENEEQVEIKLDGPEGKEGIWIDPDAENEHNFRRLEDGEYSVKVRVEDDEGRTDSDSIEFSVRTVDVELLSPEDGQLIRTSNFTVEWTSKNAEFHEIRVCGGRWENVGDATEFELTDLKDGEYDISIRAWDEDDQRSRDTVTVTVDTISPPVRIISPEDGSIFATDKVTVTWVFENIEREVELEHYEVRVNQGDWENVGDSTEYVLERLEDGEYTFEVKAIDKEGREGIENITFIVDTTDPEITIMSPSEGAELTDRFITVEWIGEAEPSGIEYYEIRINSGDWILAGQNTNYTFAGLSPGEHTVEIRAWDRAGNSEIVSVNFEVKRFMLPYYVLFAGVVLTVIIARLGIAAWKKRGEDEEEGRQTLPELERECGRAKEREYEDEYKL